MLSVLSFEICAVLLMFISWLSSLWSQTALPYQVDRGLVGLSYVIAASAAIFAMYLADNAKKLLIARDRQLSLFGGAIALGSAVWGMHLIGMLAVKEQLYIHYGVLPTLVSIVPVLIASWATMHWLFQRRQNTMHVLVGGMVAGGGIVLMHYSAMLAMEIPSTIGFQPAAVLISLLVSIALSTLAFWVRYICLSIKALRTWRHVCGGALMGAAITSMHYLSLASMHFSGRSNPNQALSTVDTWYLACLIAMGAMALLGAMTAQHLLARQRQLRRDLEFKEQQMRVIFQNAIDAIVITDHHGVIQTVNRSFESLFGFKAHYALGKHVSMLIPEWSTMNVPNKLRRQTDVSDQWVIERSGRHADGRDIPLRIALVYVQEHEQDLYVGFLMDMTQFRKQQRELEKLLTEDPLTGLFNRRGLLNVMQSTISQNALNNQADTQYGMIVLFIDLDGFKLINDQYGHAAGDAVLIEIGQRIHHAVRQEDTVCRFGGDEFVVLLKFLQHPDKVAEHVVKKMNQVIKAPLLLPNGNEVRVGCSIGVSYETADLLGNNEVLLDKADTAMYQAKKAGGNRVVYFN